MTPRAYATAQRLAKDPGTTPAERANARQRCKEYEDAQAAARPPKSTTATVPWWTLKLAIKDGSRAGRWLGNTTEFRAVLSSLVGASKRLHYGPQREIWVSCLNSNYVLDKESADALSDGRVDWTWFPEDAGLASSQWTQPPEMRKAMKARQEMTQTTSFEVSFVDLTITIEGEQVVMRRFVTNKK